MLKTLTFIRGNAIALLALFVALAGTSYAALNIPAGSVGTRQLRNGAVTGRKLAKHAVSAANFDRQSIAGYVAAWAHVGEVGANRDVIASRPQATVSTPSNPSLSPQSLGVARSRQAALQSQTLRTWRSLLPLPTRSGCPVREEKPV